MCTLEKEAGGGEVGCRAQPGCVYTAASTGRKELHPYVLETNFNPDPSLYHQVGAALSGYDACGYNRPFETMHD